MLITGGLTMLLLIPVPFIMATVNVPQSKYFAMRHILDAISVLLIMTPFYIGMNYLFKERLRFGRQYVAEARWKAAIAALDPFNSPTQRFLDGTGEAHYLLSLAYAGAGDKARAEKVKTFLQKHRKGEWVDKLKPVEAPRVSVIKAARAVETVPPPDAETLAKPHDKFSRPTTRNDRHRASTAAKRKRRF